MALPQEVQQTFNAMVNNGNIAYVSGLTATPASGAPGAYAKILADATPLVAWWLCALNFGNLSGAGAVVFNYQIARGEAGAGTTIANTLQILLEAALATINYMITLPFPARTVALSGLAARQTTASGKTLDVSPLYATGVGS